MRRCLRKTLDVQLDFNSEYVNLKGVRSLMSDNVEKVVDQIFELLQGTIEELKDRLTEVGKSGVNRNGKRE